MGFGDFFKQAVLPGLFSAVSDSFGKTPAGKSGGKNSKLGKLFDTAGRIAGNDKFKLGLKATQVGLNFAGKKNNPFQMGIFLAGALGEGSPYSSSKYTKVDRLLGYFA